MPGAPPSASHLQPGIVGQRRQAGCLRRRYALSSALAAKRRAGLLGLRQAQLGSRDHAQAMRARPARGSRAPCPDCGSPPPGACRAADGASCEPPDARLGELQAVAGGIAEVDRAPAAGPLEVGLDGDALGSPAAAARRRSRPAQARKQTWPSPSVPCGGTGSAPGAGGTLVASGLKISSTWSPQR